MARNAKGSGFERDISRRLSLWWTNKERDDVFWRVKGSGGRATTRAKSNKKTYGQHGDIGAYDPCGSPLLQMFSIELKRGYKNWCVMDVLDASGDYANVPFFKFIQQAGQQATSAGVPYFLLITQRDRHMPLAFTNCPQNELQSLFEIGPCPMMRLHTAAYDVIGLRLDDLLGSLPSARLLLGK